MEDINKILFNFKFKSSINNLIIEHLKKKDDYKINTENIKKKEEEIIIEDKKNNGEDDWILL